jgi:hypothetical protein
MKYRVMADRDGHPVLQLAKQGAGYQDYNVTHAEMAAFLADLGTSAVRKRPLRDDSLGNYICSPWQKLNSKSQSHKTQKRNTVCEPNIQFTHPPFFTPSNKKQEPWKFN